MDQISQLIIAHPYYFLLPLAIVEGPIVSFVAGFLIARGYLEPLPTFAILILGDFLPDMALYGMGRFGASWPWVRRMIDKGRLGQNQFERLSGVWAQHPVKMIFLSKLAYGLSPPLLMSAGLVGVPWRKFAGLSLLTTVVLRAILTALGFYLGGYSQAVASTLQAIELAVAAAIIAAVLYYGLSYYMRARLLEAQTPVSRPGRRSLRIAICTDTFLPQLSGIADSVEILAGQLRKAGHEVRIYAPRLPGAEDDPQVVRFRSFLIPGSGGGLALVFPFGGFRDLRRFKPDLIHTQTFSTVGMLAVYAARRLRVPLVGTDHTFPADYLFYMKLDFAPLRFLVCRAAAWYYARCDFVTAPSEKMLEELRAYGMGKPTKVISNPIPNDLFRPLGERSALKAKFGIAPEAVLFFGRIAKEKNWELSVEVFARIAARRATQLVIIGDGPYLSELEAMVRARGLGDRCRILGALRGETLNEAMNACEVLLTTSAHETQSMAMLQAAACGLPVVAVDSGGLPEYVRHRVTGYLVRPDDAAGLVDRVVKLLDDPAFAHRMGLKARDLATQFSPEAITAQMLAVYSAALATPEPEAALHGLP